MNRILLIAFFLTTLDLFGQTDSSTIISYDSTTTVSLVSGDTIINRVQLETGFVIRLSDPNAKLLGFSMIYFFDNDGVHGLQEIRFQANKAFIDEKFPKLGLFKDPKSNFITLEHVYFERNKKLYQAKSLFLPIK